VYCVRQRCEGSGQEGDDAVSFVPKHGSFAKDKGANHGGEETLPVAAHSTAHTAVTQQHTLGTKQYTTANNRTQWPHSGHTTAHSGTA
jgi:hypothetical protein